jgi:hypothetical protein
LGTALTVLGLLAATSFITAALSDDHAQQSVHYGDIELAESAKLRLFGAKGVWFRKRRTVTVTCKNVLVELNGACDSTCNAGRGSTCAGCPCTATRTCGQCAQHRDKGAHYAELSWDTVQQHIRRVSHHITRTYGVSLQGKIAIGPASIGADVETSHTSQTSRINKGKHRMSAASVLPIGTKDHAPDHTCWEVKGKAVLTTTIYLTEYFDWWRLTSLVSERVYAKNWRQFNTAHFGIKVNNSVVESTCRCPAEPRQTRKTTTPAAGPLRTQDTGEPRREPGTGFRSDKVYPQDDADLKKRKYTERVGTGEGKYCPDCGGNFGPKDRFCPTCKKPLAERKRRDVPDHETDTTEITEEQARKLQEYDQALERIASGQVSLPRFATLNVSSQNPKLSVRGPGAEKVALIYVDGTYEELDQVDEHAFWGKCNYTKEPSKLAILGTTGAGIVATIIGLNRDDSEADEPGLPSSKPPSKPQLTRLPRITSAQGDSAVIKARGRNLLGKEVAAQQTELVCRPRKLRMRPFIEVRTERQIISVFRGMFEEGEFGEKYEYVVKTSEGKVHRETVVAGLERTWIKPPRIKPGVVASLYVSISGFCHLQAGTKIAFNIGCTTANKTSDAGFTRAYPTGAQSIAREDSGADRAGGRRISRGGELLSARISSSG